MSYFLGSLGLVYTVGVGKQKIKTLEQVGELLKQLQRNNKSIGLITGCFDVVHVGHVRYFRGTKAECDVVVVGLESDESITITKGKGRPVNNFKHRSEVLSEFESVDYIFKFNTEEFYKNGAENYYNAVTEILLPTHIISNPSVDKWRDEKITRANKYGLKFVDITHKSSDATTNIIQKLESEL